MITHGYIIPNREGPPAKPMTLDDAINSGNLSLETIARMAHDLNMDVDIRLVKPGEEAVVKERAT